MTLETCFAKLPKATKKMKNILLLTHTDLDAVGAYVMIKLAYPNAEVQHWSNAMMSRIIKSTVMDDSTMARYDMVIACDISCSAEDAEIINRSKNKSKFVLLDHHDTANYLNKYSWALVQNDLIEDCDRVNMYPEGQGHSCGASLLYDYLVYNGLMPDEYKEQAKKVAFIIACYDTWDWVNVFNKSEEVMDSYRFSLLSRIWSRDVYEKKLVENIINGAELYSHDDELLLEVEKIRIDATLAGVAKGIKTGNIRYDDKFYSVVFVSETNYFTEVFDYMKEQYPNYDYYMIITPGKICIRAVNDNIHAGEFAARCGGGGHKGASGIDIPLKEQFDRLAKSLDAELFVDEKL